MHVDVIDIDRVVDGLEKDRVEGLVQRAEHVEAHQAGSRCHPEDPDQAGPVEARPVGRDVIGVQSLGGDRAGVEEGLGRRWWSPWLPVLLKSW